MSGDERKGVRGGIAGEGQRSYEEDELKIVEKSEGDKDRCVIGLVQTQLQTHKPHSQFKPQPHVVRWEKFLPLRSLRVLLVENDDSTRHVVSALLRNCSYQVTPVANGLEAWKILTDLNNQIDLVLTEVVTPGVSGIGLLSKIMSHKTFQNIPVIMMSSHDSMGVVLKCLSKGAADFLVKPIRKNELKNLWQHVWRRCHTYGGSGSESGIQTEKSVGVKNVEGLKNDTGSNGDHNDDDVVEDGNGVDTRSLDLLARDGSDNGSGTQSSWTKRVSESESSQPTPFRDQLACPSDSTFANVIYPRSEAFATTWFLSSMKESRGQNIRHDDIAMGKDLEIGLSRISDCQLNEPSKTAATSNSVEKKQSSQLDPKIDGQNFSCEKTKAGDIVGNDEHRRDSIGSKTPTILLEVSGSKNKITENCKDLPSLELSLKMMGDVTNTFTYVPHQNIFGRSEMSAFTRYNTGSTANHGQTGNVGSCSPLGINDMSSTSNRSFTKPTFQPVPNPQLMASGNGSGEVVNVVPSQESEMGRIQHHHRYHHHRHVVDRDSNDNDVSLENMDGKSPQCGSSNNERSVNEANVANCSLNGSDGGSNHGSNLQNGNNYVNAELMNTVSNNSASIKNAVDNGSGNGIRVGVDQNRSTQREAALNKFRLKRKERCFDKKVRYQSRKKLAEQRPRVRGQFVRQVREIGGNDEHS